MIEWAKEVPKREPEHTEDPFTLEIRAVVRKYYPNNIGHTISVDIPKENNEEIT